MAKERTSGRLLLEVLAGLVIGTIGLVAWAGSSSASELDQPSLGPALDQTLSAATAPVEEVGPAATLVVAGIVTPVTEQVLAPVAATAAPLTAPVTDVLTPVIDTVEGTVIGVTDVLPPPPVMPDLGLPPVTGVDVPSLPGVDVPAVPVVDPAPRPSTSAEAQHALGHSSSPAPGATGIAPVPAADAPTARADGMVSRPSLDASTLTSSPADVPSSPGDVPSSPLGSGRATLPLSSSSSNTLGLGFLLIAVLAGAAAFAVDPRSRRLSLYALLSPPQPVFAIATPPG